MSFSISPGVYYREIDRSGYIQSVATSIAVNVLRNTYKGAEYEKTLITNKDQLISKYGKATDSSYIDILSSIGYLKYGTMLYCTRVMPEDATFSGIKIIDGYDPVNESLPNYTFTVSGSVSVDQADGPYDYVSLGTTDLSQFSEITDQYMSADDVLWLMANSRGDWGNNIRVLIYNKDLYESIKYFDISTESFDIPSGLTISAEATATALSMYTDYKNNPDFGSVGYDDSLGFNIIRNNDTPLTSKKQLVILVQTKEQGDTAWVNRESHIVSLDETEIDDTGNTLYAETVINENSEYLLCSVNPLFKTTNDVEGPDVSIGMTSFEQLSGGKNGLFGRHSDISTSEAENAACISAYELYSNAEEIDVNIFIDSGKNVEVKQKLIEISEVTRKDCFAILDVLKSHVINNRGSEALDMTVWRKGQKGSTFNPNTSYAALYGNWLEVFDQDNKKYRWIPASGYMAGLYANTDQVADAWWAPAGLNRAILTGVRRLAFNPTEGERDLLYLNGINPICSFAGQGKVVWGQKTLLDKASAFNRVNVRRLFLVLEKSISKSAKYYVFEQNDEITWLGMSNMINPFLRDVKSKRGIYDYRVVIDETVNTPAVIDRNELIGDIYIKPTKSADFIRLNFIATATGADFNELIG